MPNLDQYVDTWEQAMRCGLLGGRPHSEPCIEVYRYYLRWFLEHYGEINLSSFKSAMMAVPIEHFGKRLKIYESVNSFVRFLRDEQIMDGAYLTEVKKYKPRRHLPIKKITVDEHGIEKLLDASETPLDRFLVVLLSQTGLRATEAASLCLEDIDLEKRVLIVKKAKWGKTRRIGLTDKAIEAIREYLEKCPKQPGERLMVKRNGVAMNRDGILTRIEKLSRISGVKASPHALRRAFVTINANKGRPLPMLQMACGHSDIATTRSYCLTTEDEAVEAMKGWD